MNVASSQVPVANVQYATAVIPQPHPSAAILNYQRTPEEQRLLMHLRNLAISEVVLGSLCMIIGIVMLAVGLSIVEGIWCGFWIVLAGGLGIGATTTTATPVLINVHMGFAIAGAIFSTTLFVISVIYTFAYWNIVHFTLRIILDLLSLATIVLQIVSAVFSGKLRGGCCSQQIYSSAPTAQVVYVQQPDATALNTHGYTNPVQGEKAGWMQGSGASQPPLYSAA